MWGGFKSSGLDPFDAVFRLLLKKKMNLNGSVKGLLT
ncbi:hypothetical protein P872_13905 [Rhodonellum psychrophilum GCM71 = DSM 17998]|uniref:Uncharacterized protein n=1 Tax=Rhodonellum psychrophilum GCM71 = DSM 17998 TaxID=1123057 RepID=U5BWJ3_9BACT|nr:hypothetical protein P872_13905 [Rhodonellum psychrophilum GCM71 = DSM 17998]